MTLTSISKGMGQQLFLGTGRILFHTKWQQHTRCLTMQTPLAWHFSETPSSQSTDMSKVLLTSHQLTALILESSGKETQDAGSNRNHTDQPWALGKLWKLIAVVKKHISSYHLSQGSQSCLLCVHNTTWQSLVSSAQIPSLHQLVHISS